MMEILTLEANKVKGLSDIIKSIRGTTEQPNIQKLYFYFDHSKHYVESHHKCLSISGSGSTSKD